MTSSLIFVFKDNPENTITVSDEILSFPIIEILFIFTAKTKDFGINKYIIIIAKKIFINFFILR